MHGTGFVVAVSIRRQGTRNLAGSHSTPT